MTDHKCPLCGEPTGFFEEIQLELKNLGWPEIQSLDIYYGLPVFMVYSPEVAMTFTAIHQGKVIKDVAISRGYARDPRPKDQWEHVIRFGMMLNPVRINRIFSSTELFSPSQAKAILDAVLVNQFKLSGDKSWEGINDIPK